MKRPPPAARLRELRQGSPPLSTSTQQPRSSLSSSFLSRVPLLKSSCGVGGGGGSEDGGEDGDFLQDWAAGDQVPGLLIPFAFLSSLRTNLQISTFDEIYSPAPLSFVNTSPLPTYESREPVYPPPAAVDNDGSRSLINSHPVNFDNEKQSYIPIDHGVSHPEPQVTTYFAKKDQDIDASLRLIADSVSQQRRTAVETIIFHPVVLAISTLVFLTSLKMLYTGSPSDLVLMMAVWTGYTLPALLIVRHMVKGYHDIANQVGSWSWLSESSVSGVSHKRDELLVAKSGDEIVGVLVLRMAKTVTGAGTPGVRSCGIRSRRKSSARWTGIIRAWTVRESDRGQGTGTGLLAEAVSNCRLRSLDGPIFADDHANATRVLPRMFNSVFEKQERWARTVLEHAIISQRGR